jgi:xanthine dehydrogenase accessory factor
MRAWLKPLEQILARGEAAILVHLAELRGSAPREAGAAMIVTDDAVVDTIGGGELERTAIHAARALLHKGGAALLRLSLGPQLNQCCGGSVTLVLEPFAPADLAWLRKLIRAAEEPPPVIRTLTIDAAGNFRRDWTVAETGAVDRADFSATVTASPARAEIHERMNPERQALWLFGAGHVGRAVAPVLAPLGFAMTWIDGRAGQFPEPPLAGVRQLALAMPELAVDEAPPGAFYLVMTHSHPLDEAICEAILRRGDFAYLGLIGSDTKRARFRKRLGAAGIPAAALDRIVCPIGIPGIESKEPAAIAVSVAADLQIRRERLLASPEGKTLHVR